MAFARTTLVGTNCSSHPAIKLLSGCKGVSSIYTVVPKRARDASPVAFIKQRSHDHPQEDGIRQEYENLLTLQRLLQRTDLLDSVPQPLGFDRSLNCLAVTVLPGSAIQRGFYVGAIRGFGIGKLLNDARKLGAWLGKFQMATQQALLTGLDEQSNQAWKELEECPFLGDRVRAEFEMVLATLSDNVAPVASVFCHGDFSLRNILVSPQSDIAVIDWEHMRLSHPLADPVWLICNMLLATRYWARLKPILLIAKGFLSSWRSHTQELRMPNSVARGLFVAGVIDSMRRLERKNDVTRKKHVLQNISEAGLYLLHECEW